MTLIAIYGIKDPQKLDKICQDARAKRYGYAKLEVDGLPPVVLDESTLRQPGAKHNEYGSFERVGNFVKVKQAWRDDGEIESPPFPYAENQKKVWTRQELKDVVEEILSHPPEGSVPYIIGPPLFPDIKLDAGEKLLRRTALGEIDGVHKLYVYWNISGGPTITVMHMEDADICSVNIVRSGDYKVLVAIDPGCGRRFETLMAQTFGKTEKVWDCSQFVRHISVAVLLSQLDKWGVIY
jgi:hypothetical protein